MVFAALAGDVAIVLGALGIFIASVMGTVITYRASLVTRDTHRQVVTLNESTIGELASADETRRVGTIDFPDRTAREQRHIDDAPSLGPAQGGPSMAERIVHVDGEVTAIHHSVGDDPTLFDLVQVNNGLMRELNHKFDVFLAVAAERIERVDDALGLPPPPTRD